MLLIYNGIPLLDAKLNSHDIEDVYDSSDQDFLFERHVINLTCLINPNRISGVSGTVSVDKLNDWSFTQLPGLPAGYTAREIIKILDQPRKPLKAYYGTELVLQSPSFTDTANVAGGAAASTVDANSGPHVRRCAILKDMGNEGILINFVVETCVRQCPSLNDKESGYSPIISNRYTQTHDVDSQFFTTIKTDGIALFRTDILDLYQRAKKAGYEYPDYFRKFVIPKVPVGFQRQAIHVGIVPSRNALMWSVVDREQAYYLGDRETNPWGVVDFQPIFSMTFLKSEGASAAPVPRLTFQCSVVGSNASTIWGLTSFCLRMAYSKCQIGLHDPKYTVINDATITQRQASRSVDLSLTVTLPPSGEASIPSTWQKFLQEDRFVKLLEKNGKCPAPPYGDETRGTHKFMIVANDIASTIACDKVARPKVPDQSSFQSRDKRLVADDNWNWPNTTNVGPNSFAITPGSAVVSPISNARSSATTLNGISVTTEILDDFPEYDSLFRERASWYPEFKIFVKWETHRGRLLMPICGGPSVRPGSKRISVIDTCTPYQIKKISWEGSRIGRWPELPSPYTVASANTIPDETLLDDDITLGSPVASPDGRSIVYSAKGMYSYVMQRSFRTAGIDKFENALVPWLSGRVRDTYLPPQAFVRHITEDFAQPKNDDKIPDKFGGKSYSDNPNDWGPQPKGGWNSAGPSADGQL